jgi:hypothetical protein
MRDSPHFCFVISAYIRWVGFLDEVKDPNYNIMNMNLIVPIYLDVPPGDMGESG